MKLAVVLLSGVALIGAAVIPGVSADGELLASRFPPDRHTDRTELWERLGTIASGFGNMYQFEIVHRPEMRSHPYEAWFFGWAVEDCNPGYPGCDAIYHARSDRLDGGWEIHSGPGQWSTAHDASEWVPVVTADDEIYDEWHNGDPTVACMGGRYFLALSATGHNVDGEIFGTPADTDGSLQVIMGATSSDGVHWRKTEEPLLMYQPEIGRPRTVGDVYTHGAYARPSLMWDEARWKLWFDYWAGDKGGVSLAYAECDGRFEDPGAWHILQGEDDPCLPDWPNPDVVKIGGLYYSYSDPSGYEDHGWRGRKLAEAVSLNGRDWVVLGYMEPPPGIPASHVPQALVQCRDGRRYVYLTYANQRGGDPYDYRYESIEIMRREITDEELDAYRAMLGG
ncbi:MAG: hypothetical protein GF320_12155 [Armatimonadia bacterium]|nr:hypothetical protein [Armatimonadia bacterium]